MSSDPSESATSIVAEHRYISLRTFRRDGRGVDGPMWVAVDGDHLVIRTPVDSPKMRRILADPRVEVRPATVKGRVIGSTVLVGEATVLGDDDAKRADDVMHRRYGWQYNVVPMLVIPGIPRPKRKIPVTERVRFVRAKGPVPSHAMLRIDAV